MKMTYEKPEVELIDFRLTDKITSDAESDLNMPNVSGGVDSW